MDYMLDIIIPRGELNRIGLLEVLREWGGEKYSSTPAMYVTDSNIEFMEVTDLSYYNRFLNFKISKEFVGLHLKSDIFYDFELYANSQIVQTEDNELLVFLKSLFVLSKFYIILVREDELAKEKYMISSLEELESVLLKSVNWVSPTDVVLYK